jgi:5-hydroxyisourate hydrolase
MGRLTTHVLDAAHGCPGSAIKVELYRVEGAQLELVASTLTNSDGRCDAPLLQGDDYRSGVYQLQFSAGDYYRARGVQLPEPAFRTIAAARTGKAAATGVCRGRRDGSRRLAGGKQGTQWPILNCLSSPFAHKIENIICFICIQKHNSLRASS